MNKVSFGNLTTNQINNSPELQKRIESGENFTAIDREKLKQDTVQLTQNAKETVKENFVFKTMRKVFGVEDPKKCLTSIGLTILATVGVAALGNKTVKKMAKAGNWMDAKLLDNGAYKAVTGFFENAKNKIKGSWLCTNSVSSAIGDVLKNHKAKPSFTMAKGMGQGPVMQFAFTVGDTVHTSSFKAIRNEFLDIQKKLGKGKTEKFLVQMAQFDAIDSEDCQKFIKATGITEDLAKSIISGNQKFKTVLQNLVGDDNLDGFFKKFVGIENIEDQKEFAMELTDAIAKKAGLVKGSDNYQKELTDLLCNLKDGKFEGSLAALAQKIDPSDPNSKRMGDLFIDITMDREGFIGGWWPANIVDTIGKKLGIIKKGDKGFGKGNLGDALLKFNITNGALAKTGIGKLTQNLLLVPGESISNFCCDYAGMNVFLIPMIYNLFNTAQDAPKGQKVATVADDFIGSIGNLVISMPLAFATTYGLASLKNLPKGSKNPITWILRQTGKVFGMGLGYEQSAKSLKNLPARFGGGALRFALMMFVFSPMFSKPINALIHKIFGKPYNADEAKQAKELEEQKKQIIPELGITQGELMEKMQKNPQALEKLQTNPDLVKEMEKNPKILLDILDNKEVVIQKPTPKDPNVILSPANKNIISNKTNMHNPQGLNMATKQPEPTVQGTTNTIENVDVATYIPNSQFVAKSSNLSPEQQSKYDALMARSDKVLKEAEKYI